LTEIDEEKSVYLFVHGRKDLEDTARDLLVENGFSAGKIISAKNNEVGQVSEYMALMWTPIHPSTIKIQKITKVENVEKPEGVVGLWKGVTCDDLFEIPLKY